MSAGSVPPPVRLRPELLDDVAEASTWYEAQAEGAGLDFTRTFFAAVARAARQPGSARVVYGGFRRVRLRRFPHSLYYRAEATETVFFCFSTARAIPASCAVNCKHDIPLPDHALHRTETGGQVCSEFHA